MENLVGARGRSGKVPFGGVFDGRRVLVTGHTGFKGSWLCQWLLVLGARAFGYALEPPTEPSLFDDLGLAAHMTHVIGDVRNAQAVERAFALCRPEVVFHLAAQPLVRKSYAEPVLTYETNVMGTVNVLEAVRRTPSVQVVVNVTSDKCYGSDEPNGACGEDDPMGGFDPYSSSKGCSELVTAAYRRSYFSDDEGVRLASARAGNVVGGGDWAPDRIIPDCVRALMAREPIIVRNPSAVRPWQHVLEPLSGYLWLASRMLAGDDRLDGAWNFGPGSPAHVPVRALVETMIAVWGDGTWRLADGCLGEPYEAGTLVLDCTRAKERLGWRTVYPIEHTLSATADWYRSHCIEKDGAAERTVGEIDTYVSRATRESLDWTAGHHCEAKAA